MSVNDMGLSISDDDVCATCRLLKYNPGEHSYCHHRRRWPGHFNADGYCTQCDCHAPIARQGENWSPRALWDALGQVAVDDEGVLQDNFLELYPAGTDREDIWHWIEQAFDVPVHDLMFPEEV